MAEKLAVAIKRLPKDDVTEALRVRMKTGAADLERFRKKLMAYNGGRATSSIVRPLAAGFKKLEEDTMKMLKQSRGFKAS